MRDESGEAAGRESSIYLGRKVSLSGPDSLLPITLVHCPYEESSIPQFVTRIPGMSLVGVGITGVGDRPRTQPAIPSEFR